MSCRQRGVTLIELMIGLVVLGILIMTALPSYTAWIQNTKIRTTAESVLAGLQLARAEAVRRNTNVMFALGNGPTSDWTVTALYAAGNTVIQTRPAAHGSASVTVASNAGTTITFNSLGRVPAANPVDGTVPFTTLDFDTTALVAATSRELRIMVSAGGNVKMCDPNVGATDSRFC